MAQIFLKKEYNFWDILVAVDVQPSEPDKYNYSEQGDTATLVVHDVTQKQLDDALANYDHQTFLDSLPIAHPNEIEQIRLEMARSNAEMFEAIIALMGGM